MPAPRKPIKRPLRKDTTLPPVQEEQQIGQEQEETVEAPESPVYERVTVDAGSATPMGITTAQAGWQIGTREDSKERTQTVVVWFLMSDSTVLPGVVVDGKVTIADDYDFMKDQTGRKYERN